MPAGVRNVAHHLPSRVGGWLERSHQRYHGARLNRELRRRAIPSEPDEKGLPLPPPELVRLVSGHDDMHTWLRSGLQDAELIEGIVGREGGSLGDLGAVLDFGVGCGRVARWWADLSGPDLSGCDYDGRLTTWCRSNLRFLTVKTNPSRPPLPFGDATFDFVYAISLFTHLTEEAQDSWMLEARRVLKPGGLFLFSVAGERFKGYLGEEGQASFDAGRHVVVDPALSGMEGCAAYHPAAYVRQRLLPAASLKLVDAVYEDLSEEHVPSPWRSRTATSPASRLDLRLSGARAGSRTNAAILSASRSGWSSAEKVRAPSIDSRRACGRSAASRSASLFGKTLSSRRPGDQRGLVEAPELVGRGVGLARVRALEHLAHVGPRRRVAHHRQQVGVLGLAVDRLLRQPAEGDRQPPRRAEAHRRQQQPERARDPGRRLEVGNSGGGKWSR